MTDDTQATAPEEPRANQAASGNGALVVMLYAGAAPCLTSVVRRCNPFCMNRRNFLKFPIAAAALATLSRGAEITGFGQERTAKGFQVGAKKNRCQEELLVMGGSFDLKVSSRDTDFFLKLSRLGKGIRNNMDTELKRLFEEHGMEIVGPPLNI